MDNCFGCEFTKVKVSFWGLLYWVVGLPVGLQLSCVSLFVCTCISGHQIAHTAYFWIIMALLLWTIIGFVNNNCFHIVNNNCFNIVNCFDIVNNNYFNIVNNICFNIMNNNYFNIVNNNWFNIVNNNWGLRGRTQSCHVWLLALIASPNWQNMLLAVFLKYGQLYFSKAPDSISASISLPLTASPNWQKMLLAPSSASNSDNHLRRQRRVTRL